LVYARDDACRPGGMITSEFTSICSASCNWRGDE
jgi:hypothetical protein